MAKRTEDDYKDDDALVQMPRHMGPVINIDWETAANFPPRPQWNAKMIQEARVLSMSPATYLQKLLEHIHGSAEYTSLELWEISNKSVSAFKRMRTRLQQMMIDEENALNEQDYAGAANGSVQGPGSGKKARAKGS